MKITDVKLRFAKHYLFVQVYTDAGIVGLGEAGNWGYLQATAAAIEKFADYLIGKDPFRIEDFNQNFLRSVYFRGSVIMSAISAIDIALWDIKGKALSVPVYELLGGKTRDKVRVYASVMHITEDKNELAAQYQQLQQMGFTAAKIFCNGPTSSSDGKGEFFSSRIEREVEKVRVCREAVGPDFDFILEVHRGMTLPEAVAFGRAVEPYRPMVLEDPVPPDNVDTMAEVASKIGVPIATGERAIDPAGVRSPDVPSRLPVYPPRCMRCGRHYHQQEDRCAGGSARCSGDPAQSAWPGLDGRLPADLCFHPESGHSGASRLLPERCRGQDGKGAAAL